MGQNLVVYVHNNYIYIFTLVKLVLQSYQGSYTKKSKCTTAALLEFVIPCGELNNVYNTLPLKTSAWIGR